MKHILLALALLAVAAEAVSAQTIQNNYPEILAKTAIALEDEGITYDRSYYVIPYPMGDVAPYLGCCADVVIRAFRIAFGWDLQQSIHEFKLARGEKTDTNIDHRRVRDQMHYFDDLVARGLMTNHPKEARAGDIVIFDLGWGQLHIGIAIDPTTIVHNLCCGQLIDDWYLPSMQEDNAVLRCYSFTQK